MQRTAWQRSIASLSALLLAAACSSGSATHEGGTGSISPSTGPSVPMSVPTALPESAPPRTAAPHRTTSAPSHRSRSSTAPASLPLHFHTSTARQVITVVAASAASTEGTLQAWRTVPGGWRRVGPAVHAWLGSEGLTRYPSESRSATPIGSFTLTRAFGRLADPGTALPYVRTTPAYWWISQPGPLYNTMQQCSADCAFTLGDPNEHLYYETPYYRYAVVIDYNTRNAPGGVRQDAGSAFFLHVTVGAPTQGCVSIAQPQLVRLLRWLRPADDPRILIGVHR